MARTKQVARKIPSAVGPYARAVQGDQARASSPSSTGCVLITEPIPRSSSSASDRSSGDSGHASTSSSSSFQNVTAKANDGVYNVDKVLSSERINYRGKWVNVSEIRWENTLSFNHDVTHLTNDPFCSKYGLKI